MAGEQFRLDQGRHPGRSGVPIAIGTQRRAGISRNAELLPDYALIELTANAQDIPHLRPFGCAQGSPPGLTVCGMTTPIEQEAFVCDCTIIEVQP